jgi:hypothetical protein
MSEVWKGFLLALTIAGGSTFVGIQVQFASHSFEWGRAAWAATFVPLVVISILFRISVPPRTTESGGPDSTGNQPKEGG